MPRGPTRRTPELGSDRLRHGMYDRGLNVAHHRNEQAEKCQLANIRLLHATHVRSVLVASDLACTGPCPTDGGGTRHTCTRGSEPRAAQCNAQTRVASTVDHSGQEQASRPDNMHRVQQHRPYNVDQPNNMHMSGPDMPRGSSASILELLRIVHASGMRMRVPVPVHLPAQ